ncbi:ABC transporter permease [Clostridium sp. YIM B02515]|uniref:ABC transporter permease n=1 Tax=Clostridium rhizosphaerae TaxID=2803861 RepID=A0ABS1TAZ6_9CLOT|nr:ABC transporter permease [Clostridium rhizosphaerae]MBL4936515.1 ABC transporter permease [Clostridium rhizosphaerae]
MGMIKLALINFKYMIKDKKVITLMLLMPLLVTGFICYMAKGDSSTSSFPVAVVLKDKGNQGKILVDEMIKEEKDYYNITNLSEEEARAKIKGGKLLAAYIIGEDFSDKIQKGEKPVISLLKTGNQNVAFKLGQYIDQYINSKILISDLKASVGSVDESLITKNNITTEVKTKGSSFNFAKLVMVLIVNFIIFSANYVAGEIFAQRKEKTLSRQLTTPHKPWEVSGGLILGFGLIQIVIYSFIIVILKMTFGLQFDVSLISIFIGMACMIVVSVSLGLFAVRITTNEGLLSIIVCVIGTATGFVSGSFTPSASLPSAIQSIAKFTPQYWFSEIMGGGNVIVSSILILLFGVVLFTAGSIRLNKLVKE